MTKKYTSLLLLFLNNIISAQVGVATTNPTSTLDVNGTVRVRSLPSYNSEPAIKDSIVISDGLGNIKKVSSKQIYNSNIKTFIKGSFTSTTTLSLSILSGSARIPFDFVEFDVNTEFNTNTNSFTPKQDGIYEINVQIKSGGVLNTSNNFGVSILNNGVIVNRTNFANVGILGINFTPPIRFLNTLVQLKTTDVITFRSNSDLVSITILGTKEDCFFTIKQVR
jgi:hypothetical protein